MAQYYVCKFFNKKLLDFKKNEDTETEGDDDEIETDNCSYEDAEENLQQNLYQVSSYNCDYCKILYSDSGEIYSFSSKRIYLEHLKQHSQGKKRKLSGIKNSSAKKIDATKTSQWTNQIDHAISKNQTQIREDSNLRRSVESGIHSDQSLNDLSNISDIVKNEHFDSYLDSSDTLYESFFNNLQLPLKKKKSPDVRKPLNPFNWNRICSPRCRVSDPKSEFKFEEKFKAENDDQNCQSLERNQLRRGSKNFANKSTVLFKCEICEKVFGKKSSLLTHARIHKKQAIGELQIQDDKNCEEKSKSFDVFRALFVLDPIKPNLEDFRLNTYQSKPTYKCDYCKEIFYVKAKLTKHIREHVENNNYLISVPDSNVKNGTLLWCDICEKSLPNKYSLDTHMLTHTVEKPYQCKSCGKLFRRPGTLKTHLKSHEKPSAVKTLNLKKNYECSFCGKKCSTKENLKMHSLEHRDETPFKCSICKKKFSRNSDLTRHVKIHEREKLWKCSICSKFFVSAKNLNKHVMLHIL